MNKISESGFITDSGKPMLPMERLNAFFSAHKGKRIIVRFEAVEPGSTAAQQAYYYGYVLPCVVEALKEHGTRVSEARADRWLLEQFPGDRSETEIGFGKNVTEARNLSREQMCDFLTWLQQYAAENLFIYIEDPQSI